MLNWKLVLFAEINATLLVKLSRTDRPTSCRAQADASVAESVRGQCIRSNTPVVRRSHELAEARARIVVTHHVRGYTSDRLAVPSHVHDGAVQPRRGGHGWYAIRKDRVRQETRIQRVRVVSCVRIRAEMRRSTRWKLALISSLGPNRAAVAGHYRRMDTTSEGSVNTCWDTIVLNRHKEEELGCPAGISSTIMPATAARSDPSSRSIAKLSNEWSAHSARVYGRKITHPKRVYEFPDEVASFPDGVTIMPTARRLHAPS